MIVYTGSLIWILILWRHNNKSLLLTEAQSCSKLAGFLAMLYFVFFIGLRSGGADTYAYIRNYDSIVPGLNNALSTFFNIHKEENLFAAFGILMKTIYGSNYTPYLMAIAAVSGFSVVYCLYRFSDGFFTSMTLFVLWGTWVWMINGIRQFWAVSLTFIGLKFIDDNNPILYIMLVLIASRIHTSALIMLPAIILVRSEPWELKTMIAIVLAIFAVIFSDFFLNTLDTITGTMATDYSDILSSRYFLEDSGSNPIRTLIYAIPTTLAFLERETIREIAPYHVKICVNLSVICVCISAIANVTSGIYIGRLPIYFSLYNLILLPWIFIHTELKNRGHLIQLLMIMYVFEYVYEFYIRSGMYYKSDILGVFIR